MNGTWVSWKFIKFEWIEFDGRGYPPLPLPLGSAPPAGLRGTEGSAELFFFDFYSFSIWRVIWDFSTLIFHKSSPTKSKVEGFGKPKRFQNESEMDPKSRSDKRRRFHRILNRFVMFFWLADLPILCAHAVFPKLFRIFAFFASDLFRDQKTCHKRSRNHHETTVQIQFESERFSIAIF